MQSGLIHISQKPKSGWILIWEHKRVFPRIFRQHTILPVPVWISPFLAHEITELAHKNIRGLRVKTNFHGLTILDYEDQVVVRISLSAIGDQRLKNNFSFLQRKLVDVVPKPISLKTSTAGIMHSSETLIPGRSLIDSFIPDHYLRKTQSVLTAITPMHEKSQQLSSSHVLTKSLIAKINELPIHVRKHPHRMTRKLQKFLEHKSFAVPIAHIHGDLNLDNILVNNSIYRFIDFENSSKFLVLYDHILLMAYVKNFSRRRPTYHAFVNAFKSYTLSLQATQSWINQAFISDFVETCCIAKLMIDIAQNLNHDQAELNKVLSVLESDD